MTHRTWIAISGFLWFFIGTFLLYKGLHLVVDSASLGIGLVIGFIKGRFVLAKTVRRVVGRIAALPLPIRLKDAYSKSYWILIGSMVVLGMSFRFLPISVGARGIIDVAIGSALINGALLYFRAARATYGNDSPAQSQ